MVETKDNHCRRLQPGGGSSEQAEGESVLSGNCATSDPLLNWF